MAAVASSKPESKPVECTAIVDGVNNRRKKSKTTAISAPTPAEIAASSDDEIISLAQATKEFGIHPRTLYRRGLELDELVVRHEGSGRIRGVRRSVVEKMRFSLVKDRGGAEKKHEQVLLAIRVFLEMEERGEIADPLALAVKYSIPAEVVQIAYRHIDGLRKHHTQMKRELFAHQQEIAERALAIERAEAQAKEIELQRKKTELELEALKEKERAKKAASEEAAATEAHALEEKIMKDLEDEARALQEEPEASANASGAPDTHAAL